MILVGVLVVLGVGVAAHTVATLFTDAQWGDVQSFLNFVVLCTLTYYGRRARKEIPEAAAEQTQEKLLNDHDTVGKSQFFEALMDAMESRRADKAPDGRERRHGW